MTDSLATALLAQAATRLEESARFNKRLAGSHRRQARADMQTLDQLKRYCAEHGIELIIESKGPGGHSDGRQH